MKSLETLTLREKMFLAQEEMMKMPQVEIPVRHIFSDGVYAREITVPAGAVIMGELHKHTNLNIMSAGRMMLLTDEGWKEIEAPFTVVSPPGTKRAAYAITDCVWTTILATPETDVAKIEQHFIAKSEAEYQAFMAGPEVVRELEWHS
jgi:quercetin dioxygenase-like cupin family protein